MQVCSTVTKMGGGNNNNCQRVYFYRFGDLKAFYQLLFSLVLIYMCVVLCTVFILIKRMI